MRRMGEKYNLIQKLITFVPEKIKPRQKFPLLIDIIWLLASTDTLRGLFFLFFILSF